MRKGVISLVVTMVCVACSWAEQPEVAEQTARQALMEMFFSKTPRTFVKHLPMATRTALEKSGALAKLQLYSLMANQLQTQGQNFQTFESGSVMLTGEDPKTGQRFEITVENDSLRGDHDDIELLFHVYKSGQEQRTPFMPQITFSLKQEAQVWKLNEISVVLHLPLADPDLLKAISEKMAVQPGTRSAVAFGGESPTPTADSDAMVVTAMRTILTAEATYANRYPMVGYSCTLSNLDGFGGGEPNEHQAMLISSGLASGKRYGFAFKISDCGGTPATGFHLTAAPNGNVLGQKAFCADQSGLIRSSDDGIPATCLASGTPVK